MKNLYIQIDSNSFKEFMEYTLTLDAMTHSVKKWFTTFTLIIFVSSLKDLFTWNLADCSLSKPRKTWHLNLVPHLNRLFISSIWKSGYLVSFVFKWYLVLNNSCMLTSHGWSPAGGDKQRFEKIRTHAYGAVTSLISWMVFKKCCRVTNWI